jgi:GntR family transcriptional repressor for pyruvate dehydrogenase complex
MMALFGVSRTPIREAMQSLNLLGVVDISPRRGATVRALGLESVVDLAMLSGSMASQRSVADMFAFRYAVEGAIAELAASNISAPQVRVLRSLLAENRAAVRRGEREETQQVDVLFHEAIAGASGNVVFKSVAMALNGLQVELRRVIAGIPGASQAALAEHNAIFAAIARHDGQAARLAAEAHILQTRSRYDSAHQRLGEDPSQRVAR